MVPGPSLDQCTADVVGAIAGNEGKFGALNVAAGDLTVKGDAVLQNLTVAADSALVMGKAAEADKAVGALEVKDYALVLGTLTAGKLTAHGKVFVGSDEADVAGKLVVNELVSGTVFADPAWKDGLGLSLNDASQVAVGTAAEDSTVVAGQGSLVALGTTDLDVAVKTVAAAGHAVLGTNEGQMKSAIYVDGGKTYDEATDTTSYKTIAGNVIASGWSTAEFNKDAANKTGVQVLENNLMVVDMNTIDKTGAHAVFVKDVINNGTIYLADAEFGDKVMFTEADYKQGTTGAITFNGDRLMSAAFKDKVHTIAFDDAKVASYEGLETLPLVTAMYEGKAQNGALTSRQFTTATSFADPIARAAARRGLAYQGLEPGMTMEDVPVQHVFIGSCTNARLADLRAAAGILRGRHVAPGVRAQVVPGSMEVRRQAEEEGIAQIFRDAGFEWRKSGCSLCLCMNDDILEAGVRCASTTNRNFEGRQGRGARTHLVSPQMAAAAAVTGRFTDWRRL